MNFPHIGQLNRRVTLRRRTDLPTDDLGVLPAFDGQVQRWGKLEPVGSAVYTGSMQIDAAITHRVYLRAIAGITNAHEVVCAGRVYRVKRVTDLQGAGRFTVLEVEELGNGP